jgi:hypothetical protein
MSDLCRLIWSAVIGLFRSRAALQAEVLFLRHQLNVLRRKSPRRVALNNIDRLVLTGLYYLAPQLLDALKIVKPETVIRWHRAGFRAYWRWKSRPHGGRPRTPPEIRQLIRDMSTHLIAELALISNSSAASRREDPLSTLAITLSPAAGRSAASRKGPCEAISAEWMGAPIRFDCKPWSRRHEWAVERSRQNTRWKDGRQRLVETGKRLPISLRLQFAPTRHRTAPCLLASCNRKSKVFVVNSTTTAAETSRLTQISVGWASAIVRSGKKNDEM